MALQPLETLDLSNVDVIELIHYASYYKIERLVWQGMIYLIEENDMSKYKTIVSLFDKYGNGSSVMDSLCSRFSTKMCENAAAFTKSEYFSDLPLVFRKMIENHTKNQMT